jgi:hypothetical protein
LTPLAAVRTHQMVKSPCWVITVRCLSCQHRGVIAEGALLIQSWFMLPASSTIERDSEVMLNAFI